MIVIKIIAILIWIVACITIYHNTNSFEPKNRIIAIVVCMIIMYILTAIFCNISMNDIEITNEEAISDTATVVKLIFTPINTMIFLSCFGNVIGKVKDKELARDKANKRIIIMIIIFILILVFEAQYINSFIHGVLG